MGNKTGLGTEGVTSMRPVGLLEIIRLFPCFFSSVVIRTRATNGTAYGIGIRYFKEYAEEEYLEEGEGELVSKTPLVRALFHRRSRVVELLLRRGTFGDLRSASYGNLVSDYIDRVSLTIWRAFANLMTSDSVEQVACGQAVMK